MNTFAGYMQALLVGPLAGPWGRALVRTIGTALDAAADAMGDAGLLVGPLDAQDDALPVLGTARRITRAPGESMDSYRARLFGAWESWSLATTRDGIATSVGLLGYGVPVVWPYRNLPIDGDATRWARLSVLFRGLPTWDTGARWDGLSDVWDDPRSKDAIETADPLAARPQLRRVLRQWIGARDIVDRVVIGYGSLLWDVDAVWDGEDVWDTGDGWAAWQSPDWDSTEDGAVWDGPLMAWDAFC